MNAILTLSDTLSQFWFEIEFNQQKYRANFSLHGNGKFGEIEVEFVSNGKVLEDEGEEGEIKEQIISFIDKNWDTLVPKKESENSGKTIYFTAVHKVNSKVFYNVDSIKLLANGQLAFKHGNEFHIFQLGDYQEVTIK